MAPSVEAYRELRSQLEQEATPLIELVVNGRAQTAYKLEVPVIVHGKRVAIIEVTAPGTKQIEKGFFEQIKLIVDDNIETFVSKHPVAKFDLRELYDSTWNFPLFCPFK